MLTLGGIKGGHSGPVVTAYGAGTAVSLDRAFLLKPAALNALPREARCPDLLVQPGDTLSGIADQFGVSVDTLRWSNGLSNVDALSLQQQVLIPPVDGILVTTKAGDTAHSLATKYGVAVDVIISFNLMRDPNHLAPGTRVMVPSGTGDPLQSGPGLAAGIDPHEYSDEPRARDPQHGAEPLPVGPVHLVRGLAPLRSLERRRA